MNVRLPLDSRPAPASKVDAVSGTRTSPRQAAEAGARPDAAAPADADRVELSAAARQASAALPADAASLEVEVARVALHAGSELSPARLHELRQRVRTGYYDQPAAVDRIAESAARDLAGLPDASDDA